jgi:hypothetical protein
MPRFRISRRLALLLAAVAGLTGSVTTLSAEDVAAARWSGDFETGNLSQWMLNQSCPNGVTVVSSPVRSGRRAARFTVSSSSTRANCAHVPTSSPRAQLVSPNLFTQGSDSYIAFSTYFPSNFPTVTHWLQFAEIYGPPFGGSPSMGFDLVGNHMTLQRDATHHHDHIWTSPGTIRKGSGWEDIVVHVKFSTDPRVGFVELWLNGARQRFSNGSTRIYYDTLVPGVNWDGHTPNRLFINQYRSPQITGTLVLYHDAARVGTSYAAVQP